MADDEASSLETPCVTSFLLDVFRESSWSRLRFKNSCLFFHFCWLAAKLSSCPTGGGGSVILVIRYAVDASAIP